VGQEGTPEGDKLDVLTTLIEAYENRYYPVPDADPVDILHFATMIWAVRKPNSQLFSVRAPAPLRCSTESGG
jgi:antitoxin component HigA of HigAB toxin-antitoxin module